MERITKELLNNKKELGIKIKEDVKRNVGDKNYTIDGFLINPISNFLDALTFQEILDIAKNYLDGMEELRYLISSNEFNLKKVINQFIIDKIVKIFEDVLCEIEEDEKLESLYSEAEEREREGGGQI